MQRAVDIGELKIRLHRTGILLPDRVCRELVHLHANSTESASGWQIEEDAKSVLEAFTAAEAEMQASTARRRYGDQVAELEAELRDFLGSRTPSPELSTSPILAHVQSDGVRDSKSKLHDNQLRKQKSK